MVVKFEEINFKFKKFKTIIKFKKVWIHIQPQLMLLEDTQYFQYCNTVKLHAVH